jgi:hypothetical protein
MCNKVRIVHHFRPDSSAASLFYGWCMHECADALRDRLCLEEGSRPALRLSIMKRSLYTISQARSLSIPYRSAHFRYQQSHESGSRGAREHRCARQGNRMEYVDPVR